MNEQERWLGRLEREKKAHKNFREMAEKADKAYWRFGKVEDDAKGARGFPIWWSNTQITQSAIFNRQPKPDVRRRIQDSRSDKQIATAIERCIAYQQDTTPFFDHACRSVTEFLVAGLGVSRLYLKTDTEEQPVANPLTGEPIIDETGQPLTQPVITGQYVCLEYVPCELFRWEPCKDWEDCNWVSFDRWMSAAEIQREFKVDVKDRGGNDSANGENRPSQQKYANLHLVHEIWDKRRKQIITICGTGSKDTDVLKVEKDKYGLKSFFPCERPMMLNIRSGELTPTPEYHWLSEMCEEIDALTERIRGIIKGLKDVAVFDASFGEEVARIMDQDDGARVPVPGLIQKLGQSSLKSMFQSEDLQQKAEVMVQLVNERERAKMELFELTGIADIVRGATKASETATAQQIKSNWASVRLSTKTREIAMHWRGTFRIMAELISEHFEAEQLMAQTGIQITPEMQQMMKSDIGRTYAIDIESDSTIAQDDAEEKAARLEFVQGFTQFVQTVYPMQQQGMMPADLANSVLRFFVASFPHGRVIEEQIDALPDTQQQIQGITQQKDQLQQQVEQQSAQSQQQMGEMQKALDGAMKAQADLQQKVQELTMQLEVASKQTALDPAKQMRDMAGARKDAAQADKAEAEAMAIRQQNEANSLFGGLM